MGQNRFEAADFNKSFGETITTNTRDALSRQALDLMSLQSPSTAGPNKRDMMDFLNCSENPMQKGCEGPTAAKTEKTPKDNEKKEDCDAAKQKPAHKWPPIDPAWGIPHGHGRFESGNRPKDHEQLHHGKKEILPVLDLIDSRRKKG